MRLDTKAIICAVRSHGEHGAVVRALTPGEGLQAGYVRGGRSRRLRPILIPGNVVQANYRARTEDQLAQLSVELVVSRGPMLSEPLAAAAIDWSTALTALTLPEAQGYPRLYSALEALLAAIDAAPSARGWATSLVRYEMLILAELGFGLDLSECAATGAREDLAFVSPKSGRAVSASGAGDYRERLFVLPSFMLDARHAEWEDIFDGLRITGHFIARDVATDTRLDLMAARERLIDRLKRVSN